MIERMSPPVTLLRKHSLSLPTGQAGIFDGEGRGEVHSSFLNLATGIFNCSLYLATVRRAML